jgi:hypothetical protein
MRTLIAQHTDTRPTRGNFGICCLIMLRAQHPTGTPQRVVNQDDNAQHVNTQAGETTPRISITGRQQIS